jgi:hypothetical protein
MFNVHLSTCYTRKPTQKIRSLAPQMFINLSGIMEWGEGRCQSNSTVCRQHADDAEAEEGELPVSYEQSVADDGMAAVATLS